MTCSAIPAPQRAPLATRRDDPRARAEQRLRERARRLSVIRRRVITLVGSTFVLMWGVIFVQLVTGHDPALAHHKSAAKTLASTTASGASGSSGGVSAGSTSTSAGSTSTSAGSTSRSAGSAPSGHSAVTTSQS